MTKPQGRFAGRKRGHIWREQFRRNQLLYRTIYNCCIEVEKRSKKITGRTRAHNRSGLQDVFLGIRQKIDTCSQEAPNGRGQGNIYTGGLQGVNLDFSNQGSELVKGMKSFLNEKGIALRSLHDLSA